VHHVAMPGGARRQLTFFDEPVSQVSPSPTDPNLFVFARDNGGDENFQIYIFNRAEGRVSMISDGKGRKGSPFWSKDGSKLAFVTTLEGSDYGIVIADVDNPQSQRVVFRGDGGWRPGSWSPNGKLMVLVRYVSINESQLFLLDPEKGARAQINPTEWKIAYGDVEFSADGRSIYYTSDEEGEFLDLFRYDLVARKRKNLTTTIDWDVEDIGISPDGSTYSFTTNEAGRSKLYIRRSADDRPLRAPELAPGVIGGLDYSSDGRRLGFNLNSTDAAGDVYSWNIVGRRLERWTESETGGIGKDAFIDPIYFDYPTFDSTANGPRRIPAFMYKPTGRGPHPVIISIHGGPEGQARPVFNSTYQFWAKELGAAVVLPNVRGSRGFGKTYLMLDNGMKREDSVKDIGALIDWIGAQPDLDATRIMVHGGSYGGYMVLASMVHFNDRLAGGVDIVGISNFNTFLENTAEYRQDLRREEYGDEQDPAMRAFFDRISPLNRASAIRKPLFIIQGLNDPRVPYTEAEQILAAVKKNGVTVWYMAAKDEGHGFDRKSNRDAMAEAVALFIREVFGE
ncbi:MAG: prolyl oligopeptidase family serine peptidase, partial [Parvularculaceae bacterium]